MTDTCPGCGASVSAEVPFCGQCGARLSPQQPAVTPSSAEGWWRRIPGLSGGPPWRQALAAGGYALLALFLVVGLVTTPVFGLTVLLVVAGIMLLVIDIGGLRRRLLWLNSPNRGTAATGWSVVAVLALVVLITGASLSPDAASPDTTPTTERAAQIAELATPVATATAAPSPTPSTDPTATPAPVRAPTATPPSAPTPQAVSEPTFIVNAQPVGCHQAPDSDAPIVAQRSPGTIQAMDTILRQPDATWHREVTDGCWTRTTPAPVRVYSDLARAEVESGILTSPTLALGQTKKIGSLDIAVQAAWAGTEPAQPSKWHLVLGLRLTNTGAGRYEYRTAESFRLTPGDQTPESADTQQPWLTAGTLEPGASVSGYLSFLLDRNAHAQNLSFKALRGITNRGDISVNLHLGSDWTLVAGKPPATPAPARQTAVPPPSIDFVGTFHRVSWVGSTVTLRFTVTNNGPGDLQGFAINVSQSYARNFTTVETEPASRVLDRAGNRVYYFGSLAAGQTRTYTIVMLPTRSGTFKAIIQFSDQVTDTTVGRQLETPAGGAELHGTTSVLP